MNRFFAALCAGGVAMFFAKGIGIPFWLYGGDYGDQCDIALFTFCAVWLALAPRQAPRRALQAEVKRLKEALEKIGVEGNGSHWGRIARAALKGPSHE